MCYLKLVIVPYQSGFTLSCIQYCSYEIDVILLFDQYLSPWVRVNDKRWTKTYILFISTCISFDYINTNDIRLLISSLHFPLKSVAVIFFNMNTDGKIWLIPLHQPSGSKIRNQKVQYSKGYQRYTRLHHISFTFRNKQKHRNRLKFKVVNFSIPLWSSCKRLEKSYKFVIIFFQKFLHMNSHCVSASDTREWVLVAQRHNQQYSSCTCDGTYMQICRRTEVVGSMVGLPTPIRRILTPWGLGGLSQKYVLRIPSAS